VNPHHRLQRRNALVSQALNQLALIYACKGRQRAAKDLRIGHVILTGSDVDRHLFGAYLVDGMLDVVENLTIYASAKDKALGMSKWVFGRGRLGEAGDTDLSAQATAYLKQTQQLTIVNATAAPGAGPATATPILGKAPIPAATFWRR
jgi:esterase/lipase superfamily enzyme